MPGLRQKFQILVAADGDNLQRVLPGVAAAADVQDGAVGAHAQIADDLKLADFHHI